MPLSLPHTLETTTYTRCPASANMAKYRSVLAQHDQSGLSSCAPPANRHLTEPAPLPDHSPYRYPRYPSDILRALKPNKVTDPRHPIAQLTQATERPDSQAIRVHASFSLQVPSSSSSLDNMDKPPPRPLLPAPPPSKARAGLKTPPTGTPLPPRRSASIAACELCREKKAKCDGRRPTCGRCLSNGVQCTYTTKVNETLTQADKREKARYKKERDDLLHLLTSIRDKPQREAENIFARLRVFNDPFEVCQSLRDAELLPFVSSSPAKLPSPSDANEIIDIHVPARPWTTLVNDAVVSRLVSRFFSPGSQLFPAIDRDVFVSDMQAKNLTTSKLCSPLLANAVCAMPCFELTSSSGLVELFLSQAKSILEREHGRPSLPTVLALYLLYLISTLLGRDRAGLHFRRTSLDMLEYLDLESRIKHLRDDVPDQALERRVLSKALWGIFVAER